MVYPIPRIVRVLWQRWNLRGCILFSLSLQTFLVLSASFRKRTSNMWVSFFIWFAYLLADFVAFFAMGLVSTKQGDYFDNNLNNPISDLMVFWAPFCLLHLGGPDTITAYSLQDNSLWPRHLLSLVFQVTISLYVFVESLPSNKFWLPISFLFVSGIIKYAERTRALYLANFHNFQGYPGLDYAKLMQEYAFKRQNSLPTKIDMVPDQRRKSIIVDYQGRKNRSLSNIDVVQHAHHFFEIFRGLIVDQLILLLNDRNESRVYFHEIGPEDGFQVLSAELNFFYQVLYTKALAVHSKLGYLFRLISSLAILVSFVLFICSSEKHSFSSIDVNITYVLFCGAIVLDVMALVFVFLSEWTVVALGEKLKKYTCLKSIFVMFINLKKPHLSATSGGDNSASVPKFMLLRYWSGYVRGFNLIDHCLQELYWDESHQIIVYLHTLYIKTIEALGLKEFRVKKKLLKPENVSKDLWDFIFEEIKKKSEFAEDLTMAKKMSSIVSGDWILRDEENSSQIYDLIKSYVTDVDYRESILLWHIATEICFNNDQDYCKFREFSNTLSRYMLYLLYIQPTLMSSRTSILGEIRFNDTCAEAKRFFSQARVSLTNLVDACRRILKVDTSIKPAVFKGTKSKSMLFDACTLGKELNNMTDKEEKWRVICKVWVELLSYSACRCRADSHLQLLSKGGELLTYIWLLMAHFGMGENLYVTKDNATAKLLVRK